MFITAPKAELFLESIKSEVEEIIASGQNNSARELSAATKQRFAIDLFPQYFRGDIGAKIVFVTFNGQDILVKNRVKFNNFDDYLNVSQELPDRNSIIEDGSLGELKRLQFLETFAATKNPDQQLERFYLSLIPYLPVKSFTLSGFTLQILQPYVDRVLNLIIEFPRDYVIFCGSGFEQLLKPYTIRKKDLNIQDESDSSPKKLKFTMLELVYQDRNFKVGITHSFTSLGMSAIAHSQYCKQLYDAF
ncbi:MAG: hypothetical protein QNJ38_10470 [Prochloraceae cyanobacterium]|nr:hypothetical protein [Prochloraceae cyanobacterium]